MTDTPTKTPSIITLTNISFAYPGSGNKVLDCLNLDIKAGDRIGMMAPNGSGKTTLLHTIMGLCKPETGSIEVLGSHIKTEKDFTRIRSRVGLLFQDSDDQLFCPTVLDDVAFGPLNLGYSRQQAIDASRKILKNLGIEAFEQSVTHRLSGGQKRLVALAAVLAMSPASRFSIAHQVFHATVNLVGAERKCIHRASIQTRLVLALKARGFELRLSGNAILRFRQSKRKAIGMP